MKIQLVATSLLLLLSSGACKGELQGEDPAAKPQKKKKSNVIKLTLPVAPGMHLACADVFADVSIFSEAMGVELGEIKDRSRSNLNATMVCSVVRAGGQPASTDVPKKGAQKPKKPKEPKTLKEKYAKLGVLPGDEYCQVSAYCSFAVNEDTFKRKCEDDGHQRSRLDGQFACLRSTQKGAEYSYTYKFIEPDTKCIIEALAGPSVNDETMVKNCALAARTAMTPEGLAKPFKLKKR